MKQNYILHIDTSDAVGTVGLSLDGAYLAHEEAVEQRNHAGSIHLMIEKVLADAAILPKDLSAVAVCAGPGSYTGLRIGLATAKGFCYAWDIPLLMDNKLELMALQSVDPTLGMEQRYIPIISAREGEYFMAILDMEGHILQEPIHKDEAALMEILAEYECKTVLILENDEKCTLESKNIDNIIRLPKIDLKSWMKHAVKNYECKKSVNLSTAEPHYLKQVYTHK